MQKVIALLVLATLFIQCSKDNILDNQFTGPSNNVASLRSSDTLHVEVPNRPGRTLLQPAAQNMRDNWTYSDYIYVDSVYGDLLWNDAHLEYEASAQDTLLISIPYAKNDSVTGMLYYLNESGNHRYHHVYASELLLLDSLDITSVEEHIYWELVASSFSRHQYYIIKKLDDPFHDKMLEIHNWPFAQPRCIYWKTECFDQMVAQGGTSFCCRTICRMITHRGAGCGGPKSTVPTDPFYDDINPPGNNTNGGKWKHYK